MKIAIAGYGIEGESSYKYWAKDSGNDITIVDQKTPSHTLPKHAKLITGADAFEHLEGYDLVMRTPGLAPNRIKTDGKVWSLTNEFFARCPVPIIGVTGTKGKGTTASLIASILRQAGKTVWLVGNIGVPSLDVLDKIKPGDLVVDEMSSFQLWDIEKSPHVGVLLFLEPEHLNVHYSFEDYLDAKSHITKYQSENDTFVYNSERQYSIDIAATSPAGTKVPYPDDDEAHVRDGKFYYGDIELGSVDDLRIIGAHNVKNACAAIDAAWEYVQDPATIMAGLRAFDGLPHRLKLVDEIQGVKYYDDSIATTPSATIAAIDAIAGPKWLILGGSSKGASFAEMADKIANSSVKGAILIGDEARHMAHDLDVAGFSDYTIDGAPALSKIVKRLHDQAKSGDVVLLSPGAASFGLFQNYADRGKQFIDAVHDIL